MNYLTKFFNIIQCICLGLDWNLAIMETAVEMSGLVRVARIRNGPRTFRNGACSISDASVDDTSVTSSYNVFDNDRGYFVNFSFNMLWYLSSSELTRSATLRPNRYDIRLWRPEGERIDPDQWRWILGRAVSRYVWYIIPYQIVARLPHILQGKRHPSRIIKTGNHSLRIW